MEWSRVKNILIVLLVIVNLFLFLVYLDTTVSDAKEDEILVAHTVSVLGKNGIKLNEKIIPRGNPVLYPATGKVRDDISGADYDGIRFSLQVEGELATLAQNAGIPHDVIREEAGLYRAYQKVNNVLIYNGELTYDGATLHGVAVTQCETLQNSTPYDICGLLVSASEWLPECEITAINQGFFASEFGSGSAYLYPVWRITCTQGVYYVNGMTGEQVKP